MARLSVENAFSPLHHASSRVASSPPLAIPGSLLFPNALFQLASSVLCDSFEGLLDSTGRSKLPPSRDPLVQLADNFAPVGECPPTKCAAVEGKIPECLLGGAYIRNGANPLFTPKGGYHYFDGHGMLHAISFPESSEADPSPTYCARYTRTSRFNQEVAAGKKLFPYSIGEIGSGPPGIAKMGLFALRSALGLVDTTSGFGTSNTSITFHDKKLLAMSEEDVPYEVQLTKDGDLATVGRHSFGGELLTSMCAHPKVDPETGEMFAFSFSPLSPHIRYFRISASGRKSPDYPIWLPEICIFHDFAVTKNYAIFPETQLAIRPTNLLTSQPLILNDEYKVPRFAVLPRYSTYGIHQPKWFAVPEWNSFHCFNAWEASPDEIVILGSCIKQTKPGNFFDNMASLSNRLTEVHLNLRTGRSHRRHVCSAGLDFGAIDQRLYGRRSRYVYLCYHGPWPKFGGLAKVDLDAVRLPCAVTVPPDPDIEEPCIVASRRLRFCGEPCFVPRSPTAAEDDGYILTVVHDEEEGVSRLLVMDARSTTLETVASILLPRRVPYGFHGVFVDAKQLARQR